MQKKAISLFSGGLDSVVVTKLVMEQGIEVIALHFTSDFQSCPSCFEDSQPARSAKELGIELIVRRHGMEYVDMVRSPRHGYGKNMNPCIDCRIFILKEAKKIMDEIGAGFIVTGEVLGQRPMSQHRNAIRLIEKESGLEGFILRPLSAKLFEHTFPEREGIIDREKLFNVSGRGRKVQFGLVNAYKLKEFGRPGGGCLLTDPIFSRKVKDLFTNIEGFTMKDISLLSIGRHFRLAGKTKLILGRNQMENETLMTFHAPGYTLLTPVGFKGPQGILTGEPDNAELEIAVNIMAHFAKVDFSPVSVEVKGGSSGIISTRKREINHEQLTI